MNHINQHLQGTNEHTRNRTLLKLQSPLVLHTYTWPTILPGLEPRRAGVVPGRLPTPSCPPLQQPLLFGRSMVPPARQTAQHVGLFSLLFRHIITIGNVWM